MEVVVPLSEEELRLLEQMEQALAQEDPKFVSTLRGSSLERVAKMRSIAAAVVFVAGVAMLMGGAVSQQIWLGVLGFVVMLGSATLGLAAWRGRHGPAQPARPNEDQLFDFDDHPHRFDVIEGGRTKPRRQRRGPKLPRRAPKMPRGQRQARPAQPAPGHLHAAHGAALGAPPPRGRLLARTRHHPAPSATGERGARASAGGRSAHVPDSRPSAEQRLRPEPGPPGVPHARGHGVPPGIDGVARCVRARRARRWRPHPPGA